MKKLERFLFTFDSGMTKFGAFTNDLHEAVILIHSELKVRSVKTQAVLKRCHKSEGLLHSH